MESQPYFRKYKFRIAWSAVWSLVAISVCLLWAWSYRQGEIFSPWPEHWVASAHGVVFIDVWRPSIAGTWEGMQTATSLRVPYWGLLTFCVLLPFVSWLPPRFSLRAFLFAMILTAAVLGIILWCWKLAHPI